VRSHTLSRLDCRSFLRVHDGWTGTSVAMSLAYLSFLGMCLDFFDRKILDVLTGKGESLTLAELVRDSGFARLTVIVHLERLGSGELILKEKKPSKGLGRPEFQYRPADAPQTKATPQPSVVVLEFSRLKKACRYEKGGYCKLARDRCITQNCRLIIKPNKIH
jgi:predicted transcriptional regulator